MIDGPRTDPARYARFAFTAAAWAFLACVVIQVFLVGLDVFVDEPVGSVHRDFAYTYGWLAPAMVLLSAIGRYPLRIRVLTGVLLVLFALQVFLPSLGEVAPVLAAFHGPNALAIFWTAIVIARAAGSVRHHAVAKGG